MNGQAKIDFEKWLELQTCRAFLYCFYDCRDSVKNAYYIEWFDTIGIYVNVLRYNDNWKFIVNNQFRYTFNTRQQATEKAIEQAIILYNEKFKENDR